MTKKAAPYKHQDGSNCWTKNCKLGNSKSNAIETKKEELQKSINDLFNTPDVAHEPLSVLTTREELDKAIEEGRVYAQKHPEYPYMIVKYTPLTQYKGEWDEITMAARGLIVNYETNEIVGRPFRKFFNYSENKTPEEDMTGPFSVAEKQDGSLGILYQNPEGNYEITTSGGFQSDQAAHATEIYNERYNGNWKPNPKLTYLYEIIYPENRIVVNYGDEDDIHLLGAVNKKTGKSVPLSKIKEWKWKRANEYTEFKTLEEVVSAPNRSNHEGYIVHFHNSDARVKLKHEEYLKIHKIATGVNSRKVWDIMRDESSTWDSFRQSVPEEYLDYLDKTQNEIQQKFDNHYKTILDETDRVKKAVGDKDQKEKAIWINSNVPRNLRGYVFSMLNRGKIEGKTLDSLWNDVKPEHEKGFWLAGTGKKEDS